MRSRNGFIHNLSVSLGVLVLLLGLSCQGSQNRNNTTSNYMMVIFSTGGEIIRGEKTIPAQIGTVVRLGDIIKTSLSQRVDLQTRGGTTLRIKETSSLEIKRISADEQRLLLQKGSVFADVKRKSAKEKFDVVTPTAIAGVRGTVFKVEVDEENGKSSIKVLEGKVSMIPGAKGVPAETQKELNKKEVILEANSKGVLDSDLEKTLQTIAKKSEKGGAKADQADLKKLSEANKSKAVIVETSVVDVRDIRETSTMISVDESTFDNMVNNSNKGGSVKAETKTKIDKLREEKQTRLLARIEKQASQTALKSLKDIQKHYGHVEAVVKHSGQRIKGHVVAQTRDVMIVHTPTGVLRIKRSEVKAQEFVRNL